MCQKQTHCTLVKLKLKDTDSVSFLDASEQMLRLTRSVRCDILYVGSTEQEEIS